jgi:hypothetical protein
MMKVNAYLAKIKIILVIIVTNHADALEDVRMMEDVLMMMNFVKINIIMETLVNFNALELTKIVTNVIEEKKNVYLVKSILSMIFIVINHVKIVLVDVILREYVRIKHIAKMIYFMEISVINPVRK